MNNQENCEVPWFGSSALQSYRGNCGTRSFGTFEKQAPVGREIKIDYFIESAPYGFLFTSRKTLETNE